MIVGYNEATSVFSYMRTGTIYLITNKVNDKKYVGKTVRKLITRWNVHKNDSSKGSCYALHSAIRKYGEENFTIEVIAESLAPYLSVLETFFIHLYNTFSEFGYNMTEGGDGVSPGDKHPRYGKKHSKESRAKMSASLTGKKHREKRSPEARCNMSAARKDKGGKNHPMYGKTHSEETLAKMRNSMAGENHPNYGKTCTGETRANISRAKVGKSKSEETRAKMREAQARRRSRENQ
jgi:group I intron endonuclease